MKMKISPIEKRQLALVAIIGIAILGALLCIVATFSVAWCVYTEH